jgi:hypothetical protein
MIECALQFLSDHSYLAAWLTAAATIAVVVTALVLAFRNGSQAKTVVKTLAIPQQITFHERAAKRLAKNGNLFTRERGPDGFYNIPCDSRALRRHKSVLEEQHRRFAKVLDESPNKNADPTDDELTVRHIHLLRPHIETLIMLHDELEKITGIKARDPDNIEQGAEGDAEDRTP